MYQRKKNGKYAPFGTHEIEIIEKDKVGTKKSGEYPGFVILAKESHCSFSVTCSSSSNETQIRILFNYNVDT